MSKEAVRLEGITSESGCIPKGEFVRRVRGRENAELYRRSGLVSVSMICVAMLVLQFWC